LRWARQRRARHGGCRADIRERPDGAQTTGDADRRIGAGLSFTSTGHFLSKHRLGFLRAIGRLYRPLDGF